MADRKITELTALAAGSQATGDLLTIVDVSEAAAADKNKKITVESLFKGIPGNVGINTTSPAGTFGVDGAAFFGNQSSSGSTDGVLRIVESTSSVYLQTGTNTSTGSSAALVFSNINASNEWMRIDSSGRIGVGDSSPANTLSVLGASTAGTSSTGNVAEFAGPSNTNGFQVFVNDTNNNSGIQTKNSDAFIVNPHGGNVGINVTSPDRKLEVVDTNSNGSYPLAVSNFINAIANKGAAVDFRLTTGGLSRGELGCKWVSSSASDGTYFYFAPNDGSTGNVQRLRIDDDGLKFNSDTAAANALDDYEEGTWTPVGISNFNSITNADGAYVKVGNIVWVSFQFNYASTDNSTGSGGLSGLPFAPGDNNPNTGVEATGVTYGTNKHVLVWVESNSYMYFSLNRPLEGSASTGSDFFRGSLVYSI